MVLHVSSSAPTDICGRNSSGMLPARWVSDFLHARLSLTLRTNINYFNEIRMYNEGEVMV